MAIRLELTPVEVEYFASEPCEAETTRHLLRCECGRFARWGGDRHYYNGQFNCYSYDLICSRCGTVTVECV